MSAYSPVFNLHLHLNYISTLLHYFIEVQPTSSFVRAFEQKAWGEIQRRTVVDLSTVNHTEIGAQMA